MINTNNGAAKSSNDYLENLRQSIGYGHSDKAETRTAKKELGKDDFMKLMTVQLKNQDPTSPLKNEEMAAQLAQFSGLEQMQNVNRNLEKMSGANDMRDNMMAASLIGKRIETDGSKFKLNDDRAANLSFELPSAVDHGKLALVDGKGKIVRELMLSKMEKGPQAIKWDGRGESGANAELGEYSFRVTAYDHAGKQVQAKTNTAGIISGIEFEKGKPILLVGSDRVYMDTVSKIESVDGKSGVPAGAGAGAGLALKKTTEADRDPRNATEVNPEGAPPATVERALPSEGAAHTLAANLAEQPSPDAAANEGLAWPSQMSASGGPHGPASAAAAQEAERPMVIEDRENPLESGPLPARRGAAAAADGAGYQDAPMSAHLPGTAIWNPNQETGEEPNMDNRLVSANVGAPRPIETPKTRSPSAPEPQQGDFDRILRSNVDPAAPASSAPGGAAAIAAPKLKFSSHALDRIRDRGIRMDKAEQQKLEQAVDTAAAKGARETLVLTNDAAFIVSVANKTVITALDRNALGGNVFTNIDSTIVI